MRMLMHIIKYIMRRSCVKVEVDVIGSPSLTVFKYGLCGRKATLNVRIYAYRICVFVN